MSKSFKKHCGSSFVCYYSNKPWKRQWHSAMRAKERDLLRLQIKLTENDYCYPIPRELELRGIDFHPSASCFGVPVRLRC